MVHLLDKEVGDIGYGLMGLTWRAKPQPREDSIKAMGKAYEKGAYFWNGGEFYGGPDYNSMHLVNEYFAKYPEHADKVVLSIKGSANKGHPDGRPENVRRSIDECLKLLDGKKSLDLFEAARVDPNVPYEETIKAIDEYVKAGKVGGISLSEVNADHIRRAAKVAKISAVEVEVSMWATEPFTNGIAEACAELKIPIIAYCPLGRGFLTGQIKSFDDLPADDMRRHMPRFQPDVFGDNMKLVSEVEKMASKKNCTSGQIAISWLIKQSGRKGNPVILPIPGATTPSRIEENTKTVDLTEQDMDEIEGILKSFEVKGGRYPAHIAKFSGY